MTHAILALAPPRFATNPASTITDPRMRSRLVLAYSLYSVSVLGVLFANRQLSGQTGARQDRDRCTVVASAPLMLHTRDGRPAYVEAPTGYGSAREFTVLGAPSWEWYAKESLVPSLPTDAEDSLKYARTIAREVQRFGFRVDSMGAVTALHSDTSEREIHRPMLVRLSGRSSAVLWVERRGDPSSSSVTLWYSREDQKYSGARHIWSGSQLHWDGSQATYNSGHDVALFAVPFFETGRGGGLLFIRLDKDGVRIREVPRNGLPDHASVVSLDDAGKRWLVVYSASDTRSAVSNGSHLYSGSFSWETGLAEEKRIQWSGLEHASHPLLSRIGASRELRLAWTLSVRASPAADSLVGWVSRDAGASWLAVGEIALPGQVSLLTAAHAGEVPVYAAFLSGRPDTSLFVIAQFSTELRQVALPAAVAASAPQWIQLGQRALLLWGVTRKDAQGSSVPATEMARFTLRCWR